jgi:hypothetical protein
MTAHSFRKWTTEELLRTKDQLVFEKLNWERRIEEQTEDFNDMLRPIRVYQRWVKECQAKIDNINVVLAERVKD